MGSRTARLGVRARATIVAVIVVAVALAAGTLALLALTGDRIESSIRAAALARADSVVDVIAVDALTDPLPGRDPELFAQVVDAAGAVVASDRAIAGIPAVVSEPGPPVGTRLVVTRDDILEGFEDEAAGLEDQGPYAVAMVGVTLPSGPGTVLVAASLEDAAQARNAILPVLGLGLPMLLVLVAAIVWILTGRALRPVADMSAQAEAISALALDTRLPLPKARDELRHLATTLNEMLERLEAAALRQRRFVSDASHELKSPLAAIRTIAEVAADDGSLPSEAAADIAGEVDRLQALVADLLLLAHHDESPPEAAADEVDLDQVALAVAGSVRRRGAVRIDTTGVGAARVRGDAERLTRLVRNIVDNAVTHAASTVSVAVSSGDGRAVLTVGDDGPGIRSSDAERVFERFVRLDESRARDTGGSGLGLAVARAIAREHGGDVSLVSGEGSGARFEVWLPA